MYRSEKFGQLEVKWRPIDSYVTNARKCLEVGKNGSLYKERIWKIFVERYKKIIEEWKDICNYFSNGFFVKFFPLLKKIILVRHPWGPRNINREYEHIDIQSLLEPRDDTPAKEIEKMSVTLETMRKDYKNNDNMINQLMKTPEDVVDFDRTWNGTYSFVRCEECNGLMLGHRAENCRKLGDG